MIAVPWIFSSVFYDGAVPMAADLDTTPPPPLARAHTHNWAKNETHLSQNIRDFKEVPPNAGCPAAAVACSAAALEIVISSVVALNIVPLCLCNSLTSI
jgi:hypothetical protein